MRKAWGISLVLLLLCCKAASASTLLVKAKGQVLQRNGVPWLTLGDGSAQDIMGLLTPAEMAQYFSMRHAEGFNAVWVNLLCASYTGCASSGAAQDGTLPFTTGSSPANYDLSTPNPAYFAEVDNMVKLAASYRIVVILDPAETGGWLTTLVNNGNAKAFNYGAYVGHRYRNFNNIIWLAGNDFQSWSAAGFPQGTTDSSIAAADNAAVTNLMAGIASVDANHLQSIELDYYLSGSLDDSSTVPYTTLASSYTYYPSYYETCAEYTSSVATVPVFLVETYWANATYGNLTPTTATNMMLRAAAYWTVLAGGFGGYVFGDGNILLFPSGWQANMATVSTTQLHTWWKFFTSLTNWQNLVPDTVHAIVTSGYDTPTGGPSGTPGVGTGNMSTDNYSPCAGTADTKLAVCYDPQGNPLTVALSWFTAPARARWFDPTSGVYTTISGSPFGNSGTHSFATSGNNSSGDHDWILVLDHP